MTDNATPSADAQEEWYINALEWRGLRPEYPDSICKKCHGAGSFYYPNTSTWRRGGICGQAFTMGICDECWGSGEWGRPWTNLRELEARVVRSDTFLKERNVGTPCSACHGMGVKWYSSGATWHGGMGTASCEKDVCDTCWGSGDAEKHWLDLRENAKERSRWEASQVVAWFKDRVGFASDTILRRSFDELDRVLDKETRRRKLPEGLKEMEYGWAVGALRSALRKMRGLQDEV